ncbi:hypothetical protein HN446_03675 [bacterium]|jgi:tetratricopeptide (TPR) repeat protein|nr:hypothetical protein [bacterium]
MIGRDNKNDVKELENLKKKLKNDPKNVELILRIARFLCEPFHEIDEALIFFDEAISIVPRNPDVFFWKAYFLYLEKFDYVESKKNLEKAISIDSKRSEFYFLMFYILFNLDNKEKEALKYLLKSIELEPGWLSPISQYVSILINQNEFEKARKEMNVAYKILSNRYKKKIPTEMNILEKYHIELAGGFDYEFEKNSLDRLNIKLEEKIKTENRSR